MKHLTKKGTLPSLDVKVAGVHFSSPIGLAAIGGSSYFGKPETNQDQQNETDTRFLLKNVKAGSSYIYLNCSYLTAPTLHKLQKNMGTPKQIAGSKVFGSRFMPAATNKDVTCIEGLYSTVSGGPSTPIIEWEDAQALSTAQLIRTLNQKKPIGVPIIGGVIGCGGLPDAYVEGARKCEEMEVDLIEVNFHCPLQAGMAAAVDTYLHKTFPAYSQGGLIGDHPEIVEAIVGAVVRAVDIPVGVKFSAETGFPRIVGLARRVRDAGAKYIHVGGAAVGIAPPDIYNRGKSLWPYANGNPFCLTSGAWMRRVCYRDVAAVARFVPELDIAASGGLVTPEHCVEVMMLGASLTQLCAGVIEQGRAMLRHSTDFLRQFMKNQGYSSVSELVGLGQPHIKYLEEMDLMADQLVSQLDDEKCIRCGRCVDSLCVAIHGDNGKIGIDEDRCTGCGACSIVCPGDAFKLVLK